MTKQKNIIILPVLLALMAGLGGGYWFAVSNKLEPVLVAQDVESTTSEPEVLFYRNPMNPAITSPVPAQDEMGMDYIPVYPDGEKNDKEPTGTVNIDPVIQQNIGVRTALAEKRVLNKQIRAVGRIDYDEELLYRIHPKVEGWIEELNVKKTGEKVLEDTILLSVYSPQLVTSQQEYLIALNNYKALSDSPVDDIRKGAEELVASSKKRLEFMDVPAHQLNELIKDRVVQKSLHIHSPYTGIVLDIGIREGDYITPKTTLYTLADLSRVWVYVDVYEYELPWLNENDMAEMTLAAVPDRLFEGKVAYIYPYMEKKTRTVKVRIEFDNSDGLLKPDMFSNVTIKAGNNIEAVVVPSEAIVRSGKREQVFIKRDKGKFEPREVKTGITSKGLTQILDGVKPGEIVVTSSQFLIDSESKLREATAKMMEALSIDPSQEVTPENAEDMDMSDLSLDDQTENELDMSEMTIENLD